MRQEEHICNILLTKAIRLANHGRSDLNPEVFAALLILDLADNRTTQYAGPLNPVLRRTQK
jgi:hypothetical protein